LPQCGGTRQFGAIGGQRLIAFINDVAKIRTILDHIGIESSPPKILMRPFDASGIALCLRFILG
jgi:hypothetical protein